MKRFGRLVGSSLGILLLLSLAVLLAASAGWLGRDPASVAAPAPSVLASAVASPSAAAVRPAATVDASSPALARPAQVGARQVAPPAIAACTFRGGAPVTLATPQLDQYTFGQPEVVIAGRYTAIDGWLPDNQRLLVTQRIPNQATQRLEIRTVDVQTKAEQRYAERTTLTRAAWLPAEQAVAFAEVQRGRQVVLGVGRGPAAATDAVATDLASPFVSARPDGQEVVVFATNDPGQPQAVQMGRGAQRGRRALGPVFRHGQQQAVELDGDRVLRTAWSPDGKQLIAFNADGFYLVDVASGRGCSVDLGSTAEGTRWARDIRWSPDSRLVAARTTISAGAGSVPFLNLTILDTLTGELQQITLDLPFVDEAEWLPNSRQMVAMANVNLDDPSTGVRQGLFVVDVVSGAFRRVVPELTFGFGLYANEGGGLAVAPDGQRAAVKCPLRSAERGTVTEDRVCIVPITLQP